MAQREWLCPRRVAGAREGTGAIHTLRVDVSQRDLPTQVTTKAAGILRSCMKARKERSKSSPGNRRITWTWHPCARLVASTISRPPSSFPAGGAALFIPPAPDTLSGFDFVCDIVWRSPPSALRAAHARQPQRARGRTARRAADPLHLLRTIVKSGTRGAKEVASSFTKAPHSWWCAAERCQCDGWRRHGYPQVGGAKNERSAEQQCFLQPATPRLHKLPAQRNDKDSRESLPKME